MAALMCAASCSDNLQHGVVDLGGTGNGAGSGSGNNQGSGGNGEGGGQVPDRFEYPASYVFNHPCALVTADDIARVKSAVASANESDPVYAAYKNFCKSPYVVATYKADPVETIVRGDATGTGVSGENYGNIMRDASAAYQLALRWKITDDTKYADAAVTAVHDKFVI